MLSNKMKDVYQNAFMERVTNKESFIDLIELLEYANANKKITYDLPKFITFMVLHYEGIRKSVVLQKDFKTSLDELLYLYGLKPAFELEQWINIRGITWTEFENRTGLTKKAVLDIRKGESRPKYDTLLKILEALDISFYELKFPPKQEK